MSASKTNLLNFIRLIEECSNASSVWEYAQEGLGKLGFEYFIYTTVDPNFENPFCLSNLPDLFSQTTPSQDPFLKYCCDHYDFTFTGAEFLEDYDYLPDTARAFISAAKTLGFHAGYGVPVKLRSSTRFGGFNLGTGLSKTEFTEQMEPLVDDIRFFCLITHRKIEELTQTTHISAPDGVRDLISAPLTDASRLLSSREREVVYHIGQGLSRKECATVLGISHNTVSDYIKSAYRKLGVRNRVDAARKLVN